MAQRGVSKVKVVEKLPGLEFSNAQVGAIQKLPGQFAGKVDVVVDQEDLPAAKHFILVVDVSTSTRSFNPLLVKKLLEFNRRVSKNDWITVIKYSGEGSARVVVGPIKSESNEAIIEEKIRRGLGLMGNTVFKEALQLSLKTVTEFGAKGVTHVGLLFTDGLPEPSDWDRDREERESIAIAERFGLIGVPLIVHGHGPMYGQAFMQKLADASRCGVYLHSAFQDDIGEVLETAYDIASKLSGGTLELAVNADGKPVGKIFRITPDYELVGKGEARISSLFEGKAQLVFELSGPATLLELAGEFNGKSFKTTITPGTLTADAQVEYAFALASASYDAGDSKRAADTLNAVGAEEFAIAVENSQAPNERRKTASNLRSAYRRKAIKIGKGYNPGSNDTIAHLMIELSQPENGKHNKIKVGRDDYERTGKKQFEKGFLQTSEFADIVAFVAHEKRLNITLRRSVDGVFGEEEDESGGTVGVKRNRGMVIVKDNGLHTPTLKLLLLRRTFDMLVSTGKIPADAKYSPTEVYEINLSGMYFANKEWNPHSMQLVPRLVKDAELTFVYSKVNAKVKSLLPPKPPKEDKGKVKTVAATGGYFAPHVTYTVEGTGDAALKKRWEAGDSLGGYTRAQVDALTDVTEAKALRKKVYIEREQVRFYHRMTTIAMENRGGYFGESQRKMQVNWSSPRFLSEGTISGKEVVRREWQEVVETS